MITSLHVNTKYRVPLRYRKSLYPQVESVPCIQHLLAISHSTRAKEYISAFLNVTNSTVSASGLSRNSGARYLASVRGLPLHCDDKLRSSFIASERSAIQHVPAQGEENGMGTQV